MPEMSTPSRLEAFEVDRAEIIPSDAGDDRAWLTELAGPADEDGRCTGREGADERRRLPEPVTLLGRDDLDENLADRQYLVHVDVTRVGVQRFACLARTSSQTATRITSPLTISW